MTDTLREKVARAICDSMEADNFDELGERSVYRAAYLQQADAAILAVMEALQTPTEAMQHAGWVEFIAHEQASKFVITRAFQAMLTAYIEGSAK